jgi:hypothetical protein
MRSTPSSMAVASHHRLHACSHAETVRLRQHSFASHRIISLRTQLNDTGRTGEAREMIDGPHEGSLYADSFPLKFFFEARRDDFRLAAGS